MPQIAIVWDFDGTLTPDDSTTKTVEILRGDDKGNQFWDYIKSLRGDKTQPKWEHVLAMDAPIWMYSLSRLAASKKVPLNSEFFGKFVLPHIKTYTGAAKLLKALKDLSDKSEFKDVGLEIHHFIVTAGLKDLVELVFPEGLITWTFGCRYTVIADKNHKDEPESIPVFCMDETVKTRSIFEIAKGAFCTETVKVNTRVEPTKLWAPFNNIIYIGDGDTDIPALSLVRSKGGMGVAVYNPEMAVEKRKARLKAMRMDRRADLITPADFSAGGELSEFLKTRCTQILQRYQAEKLELA